MKRDKAAQDPDAAPDTGAHDAVLQRLNRRGPNIARMITLVFSMFLLAAGVWANVTQVPGLVRAEGTLTAAGNLRRVEHLQGGTVAEIAVIAGDVVKQGQIIARLSPEIIDIQIEQLSARAAGFAATIRRSQALLSDLPTDPTPQSILDGTDQSHRLQSAQLALRLERRRAATELIRERAGAIKTLRAVRDTAKARADGAADRFESYERLQARGVVSALDLNMRRDERDALVSEYLRAEVEMAAAHARLVDAESAHKELVLAAREETLTALNDAMEKHTEIRHQLLELQLKRVQLDIRAPIDGVIQTIAVGVPGEVVEPGGHVADLLPNGERLIAELNLLAKDVGQVAIGDDVAINVTTYARNRYGQVTGRITGMSPTSITEHDKEPYFRITVALDSQVIGLNGDQKPLRAGMTIQAEIVTTARTVAQYLLKPLEATMAATMTEK